MEWSFLALVAAAGNLIVLPAISGVDSVSLILEYEEVLLRQRSDLGLTQVDIDDLIDSLCAEAEHHRISNGTTIEEAIERVFYRGLAKELQDRLKQKNLGLDYSKIDPSIARGGDIKYIDFRKDWSPHFKRKCVMPDGKLVETSGLENFAEFHGITHPEAKGLLDHGGTVDLKDQGVLACQVINGQPTVARFNARQYAKAKEVAEEKEIHIMDALSEVALNDPVLMRALRREESGNS